MLNKPFDPHLLKKTVCDGCGAADGTFLFEGPDRLTGLPGVFRLVSCAQCGLIRQDPCLQWDSLKDYYPENYISYAPLISQVPSWWKRLDRRYGMKKRVRAIKRVRATGNLLEVGCGTGIFLEEASRSNCWSLVGIEPNEKAAHYARTHLELPIHQGLFSEFSLPPDHFDIITLWNVLEHMDKPFREIRHAHDLLKKGGWLVFSIPNLESLGASLFGSYWLGYDLPRHLYLFPKKTLKHLLEGIGFNLVDIRCLAGSHAAYSLSLEFWSQDWPKHLFPLRPIFLKSFNSMVVRLGLGPFIWLIDWLLLSCNVTIFAQKKG